MKPRGPPPTDGPLELHIGFNLLDITDVDEKEETIAFEGAVFTRWKDPRLAYDPAEEGLESFTPGEYSGAAPRIYQGSYATKELFHGWRPHMGFVNAVGARKISYVSIGVWPDGTVKYAEFFGARIETPMALRKFPFDRQELRVHFSVRLYPRERVLLVYDNALSGAWDRDFGIAEWEKLGLEIEERASHYKSLAGTRAVFSQLVVTVQLARLPGYILLSLVLPLTILVSLTFCVFWMEGSSIAERVNISFIGILSVVAYYFVVLDGVPEIPYITLMDAYMIANLVIMATSTIMNIVAGLRLRSERREIGKRIDRICRWAFPIGYLATTGLLVAGFVLAG